MEFLSLSNKKRRCKNARNYLIDWSVDSRSKFQTEAKKFLSNYWQQNIVFEEFPIVGTRLTLDFYNANKKIAIEVQGRQHTGFVKFFHCCSKFMRIFFHSSELKHIKRFTM